MTTWAWEDALVDAGEAQTKTAIFKNHEKDRVHRSRRVFG